MSMDLDTRAREAAMAARASVSRAADHAVQQGPPPRRVGTRRAAALAAAVVVLVGVAALVLGPVATTDVTTGPAAESGPAASNGTTLPPPPVTALPPPPAGPPPLPEIGQHVANGTTRDGRRWILSIGGPSNELCFQVYIDERNAPGMCAGRPGGAPLPADERFRPLHFQDVRYPAFVFGRMPDGVTEVEAVLESGTMPRQPVVLGADGAVYYAVELDRRATPTAVVGHRRDGTTARHVLAR